MSHKKLFFITILTNAIITTLLITISKNTALKVVKPKKKVKINFVTSILVDILLLTALLALFGCIFFWRMFPGIVFTQFMFTLTGGGEGANMDFIIDLILSTVYYTAPIFLFFTFTKYFHRDFILAIRKKIKINLSKIFRIAYKITIPLLWVAAIVSWSLAIGLPAYIKNFGKISEVISENYIPVNIKNIIAPKQKRNLIYIFVESLETGAFSKDVGGAGDTNYFPRLTELSLRQGVNFSEQNYIGQLHQQYGTSWTVAGLIAQTSGMPFQLNPDKQQAWDNSEGQYVVPNIPVGNTLGDVLRQNNYNQAFLVGSDANFGSRAKYFQNYGGYQIRDLVWAKEQGLIPENYDIGWWGYEDRKLYEFAKDELKSLSEQDQPFNLTMLTVDTHFYDGYLDGSCAKPYAEKYSNVLACADNMLADFIEWVQEQPFYDNTTIVVAGDHLFMSSFYDDVDQDSRKVFATILNSPISINATKNRLYSHFDMFPTTLAAMGFKIKGNRLALGVNLFSGHKTLVEHFGVDTLNDELSKNFKLDVNEDY